MASERDRKIRERAYELWVQGGRRDDTSEQNWHQAEQEFAAGSESPDLDTAAAPKAARGKAAASNAAPATEGTAKQGRTKAAPAEAAPAKAASDKSAPAKSASAKTASDEAASAKAPRGKPPADAERPAKRTTKSPAKTTAS